MKIVLYKDNRVLLTTENVLHPVVDGDSITWESGSIADGAFLVLDDNVDVSGGITDEILALDKRADYVKQPPVDELTLLKRQQTDLIYELMLKGAL